MKIIPLGLVTSLHGEELEVDRDSEVPTVEGALGSGLAAPSPHPASLKLPQLRALGQTLLKLPQLRALGQILLQHQAASPSKPAGPPQGTLLPRKRVFHPLSLAAFSKSCSTAELQRLDAAGLCHIHLSNSFTCHWQSSLFSFKAFEELACARPTVLNRLSES